ncbi:Splicing factor [Dionaea muscipula]
MEGGGVRREKEAGGEARHTWEAGDWNPILRRRYGHRNLTGRVITVFVEDIPDSMNQMNLRNMFSRFGVVLDVFIPRKLNKAKRRFGFIRYGCPVAAEVAI